MSKKKKIQKMLVNNKENNVWCESPYDERDYSAKGVFKSEQPLPKSYITPHYINPLNQGTVGSCVAHSIALAMMYGEEKIFKSHRNYSRGYIYANRSPKDYQGSGMFIREALKQANHCGDVIYDEFPYNIEYPQITQLLKGKEEELAEKAKPYSLVSYFRCYTIEEIKTAVINYGAVIIGMPLYDDFGKEVKLPTEKSRGQGGHAMVIIGWTEDNKWIVENHWGKWFGNKGMCYVPFEYPISEFWGIVITPVQPECKSGFKNWLINIFKK